MDTLGARLTGHTSGGHLHFVQAADPLWGGGLGTASIGLHESMLRSGIASMLVTTSSPAEPPAANGIERYRRVGPTRTFFSPAMWWHARSLVDSIEFSHGHGLYTAVNWCMGRAARLRGVALVYHPHGMFEPYILARSRLKKRLVHWLFENANVRAVRVWRALTSAEADQITAIVPGANIVVVPNGVRIPAAAATPVEGCRRLGYLGRIHEKKGLLILLQAWAALASRFPDWELVIAGPGSDDYVQAVNAAAASLPRVQVIGAMTGATKEEFLRGLSAFVLPSYSEGFPMSVLEAMAAGVPVVVTRTSNAPTVDAVGAGWTCEPETESVRRALQIALQCSATELTARGAAGRELVRRDFSWQRVTALLVDACRAA